MAEAIVFSLASKVLSAMASPAFTMAYEKGVSIWDARSELNKLEVTIGTIKAVLLDAEEKQESSAAVKNWIQRLKAVLYDVEDFFDEVLTEDLLKEQMMGGKNKLSLNQVRVCCSKLNPVVFRNSITKKVKVIRGRLAEISNDINQLGFVKCLPDNRVVSMGSDNNIERRLIGEKSVIGRDDDKNVILEMLISKLSDTDTSDGPVVIAIDGIGGMGKTTIAHMIYKHEEVEKNFEKKWFACISDTSSEIEVLEKIYQPMSGQGTYSGLNEIQLLEKIENSIKDKKYLLVLDDVWEADRGRWEIRKSRLSCGAKGSKIIVTTRLPSVVKAMGAVGTHNLKGLSEEGSWNLFKSLAFDSSDHTDQRREKIGRELLKRFRGVPLAIRSMGSLLHNKTIDEWEEIERVGRREEIESVGLPTVGGDYNSEIMSVLKLSYNHLPSNLKQCFTYCSLFPKDFRYSKMELIFHWVSHGYINLNEGEFSFMHLLRMGFFQEVLEDEFGQISSCKMHDIMHDLAMHVGGEEIIMMSGTSLNVSGCTRHVSLDGRKGRSWNIPTSLLDIKSIRSFILDGVSPNLDQLCSNFKLLRTLTLSGLSIKHIPPSIGKLKLVRYLDLSNNKFEELPDSMGNLVNLLVLNISLCLKLKAWPRNFNKLIKLWCLNFTNTSELRLMPEGFGEMPNLQYLSSFVVGKGGDLDVLNVLLKQLRNYLPVKFCEEMEVEDGLNWQLPADVSLQSLDIDSYPGYSIRGWENNDCTSKLVRLKVEGCRNVKYLPHFSCLPNLKWLTVAGLWEIEFMEEVREYSNATSTSLFFPCLEELRLKELPKLKGWRGEVAAEAASTSASSASSFLEFSDLLTLAINECPNLESFPQCPNLKVFSLSNAISSMNLFSYTYPSLRELKIDRCERLEKIHLSSPHLQRIRICRCNELMSIELAGITPEPSLRYLDIEDCYQLKSLCIEEHAIAGLWVMTVTNCSDEELRLELTETQGKRLPKVEGCKLELSKVGSVFREQLFSLSYFQKIWISYCNRIESLRIPSPHLREVYLKECMELISVELEAPTSITIRNCCQLKNLRIAQLSSLEYFKINSQDPGVAGVDWDSIPNLSECSSISEVYLWGVDFVFIERLLPSPSTSTTLQEGEMTLPASLQSFTVDYIKGLKILNNSSPLLRELTIDGCSELTNVSTVHSTALRELNLINCRELQQIMTGMDWDSLPNLERLLLRPMPPRNEIPKCLIQRQALGHLLIPEVLWDW